MIDIQKLMIQAMKKQLFPGKDELNIAARQVLGEIKTKIKDIKDNGYIEVDGKLYYATYIYYNDTALKDD